jgi:hypothetical protein
MNWPRLFDDTCGPNKERNDDLRDSKKMKRMTPCKCSYDILDRGGKQLRIEGEVTGIYKGQNSNLHETSGLSGKTGKDKCHPTTDQEDPEGE